MIFAPGPHLLREDGDEVLDRPGPDHLTADGLPTRRSLSVYGTQAVARPWDQPPGKSSRAVDAEVVGEYHQYGRSAYFRQPSLCHVVRTV